MWDRVQLKTKAKKVLKKNYWKAFLISFIIMLVGGDSSGGTGANNSSTRWNMGHKFDIWVLDLSFFGWYLLGVLTFGIGTFFVSPYDDATNAELYLELRENAVRRGMCTCAELNLRSEEVFR